MEEVPIFEELDSEVSQLLYIASKLDRRARMLVKIREQHDLNDFWLLLASVMVLFYLL